MTKSTGKRTPAIRKQATATAKASSSKKRRIIDSEDEYAVSDSGSASNQKKTKAGANTRGATLSGEAFKFLYDRARELMAISKADTSVESGSTSDSSIVIL